VVGPRREYPRGARLGVAATVYLKDARWPSPASASITSSATCRGYGWLFPAVDGLANAGVYQRADHYDAAAAAEGALLHAVPRSATRTASDARRSSGRAQLGAAAERADLAARRRPGPARLRDAGSFVDPLSGEGIWQALRTGQLAAEHAGAALTAGARVDAGVVRRYRLACARAVCWPSLVRAGIQEGMRVLIDPRPRPPPPVRGLLQWGYGSGRSELSRAE
jgi:flavin-dependent dehydrogenase